MKKSLKEDKIQLRINYLLRKNLGSASTVKELAAILRTDVQVVREQADELVSRGTLFNEGNFYWAPRPHELRAV